MRIRPAIDAPIERIVGEQRRAVEIRVVEQRREVGRRGDAETRLDHAARTSRAFRARARSAIMRSASRSPPHFASLMLIPSTAPASRGMSRATTHDSSATTGSGERSRTKRRPSMSCARQRLLDELDAVLHEHVDHRGARAWASTRRWRRRAATLSGAASRTMRMISSSRSGAELDLENRILRGLRDARARASAVVGAMPIVKLERGARAGSSPHNFQSGTPSRLPARSCSAALIALLAEPLKRSARSMLPLDRPRATTDRSPSRSGANQSAERRDHGVGRLAVEAAGRGLAPPFVAVGVGHAHPHDAILGARPPRAMTNGCFVCSVRISCDSFMSARSMASRARVSGGEPHAVALLVVRTGGAEERDQRVGQIVAALVALAGVLREAPHDDLRHARRECASRRRRGTPAARARACSRSSTSPRHRMAGSRAASRTASRRRA